ncbi:MAG TPA: substrate-binding domain-containing protein [Acidimicrobiales bacterium]|nr:substrate-binding domain-containing protein [Acidimicrobiales bacterium]
MRLASAGWLAAVLSLTTAACSSAAATGTPEATVDVLYAGSLTAPMEQLVGPAFSRASGYRFSGTAGGSVALANEVVSQVRSGDVFVSASPAVDDQLARAGAGGSWYVTFASVPLVLGYVPGGRVASLLRRESWSAAVTTPGVRVGRTDPALDPKGALTVEALDRAAATTHDPALTGLAHDGASVFPEESLLGRLQTRQLDAAFLYRDEAVVAHVPFVPVGPDAPSATYTVTVLAHATDRAGALAFVRFLLGHAGQLELRRSGVTVLHRVLHGTGAPAPVRAVVGP